MCRAWVFKLCCEHMEPGQSLLCARSLVAKMMRRNLAADYRTPFFVTDKARMLRPQGSACPDACMIIAKYTNVLCETCIRLHCPEHEREAKLKHFSGCWMEFIRWQEKQVDAQSRDWLHERQHEIALEIKSYGRAAYEHTYGAVSDQFWQDFGINCHSNEPSLAAESGPSAVGMEQEETDLMTW